MRLGIDFGTTRIVAAFVDRGNYPVISFEDNEGASREWFPPLVALRGGERRYGWDAWAVQTDSTWTLIRSIKRTLENAGPYSSVETEAASIPVVELLTEMVSALGAALLQRSTLPAHSGDTLEVMIGVPANANSNQRFLTVEPFLRSGFEVLGLLNEPSAASIEYGHRSRGVRTDEQVLVYDLGGGTFDASLVSIRGRDHFVVASDGISAIGGDEFDLILAEMALEAASISAETLSSAELFRLHEECRFKKEAIHPNTRRIVIDLGAMRDSWAEITVSAAEFFERCRPLVDQTVAVTENLLKEHDTGQRLEALYVTGGGSELPIVARVLREEFGKRTKRSAYTRSATAIGLAIQADAQAGYVLHENFTRNFGVWRESEAGREVTFDPLFQKGTALPGANEPPLELTRRYCPVHNIGHFRYLECSHCTSDGKPTGEIAVWDEIRFPFDPALQNKDLASVPVEHAQVSPGLLIEEQYACDATGAVTVKIANLTDGYSREFRLGKWASDNAPVTPIRKRKAGRS